VKIERLFLILTIVVSLAAMGYVGHQDKEAEEIIYGR